MTSFAAFTVIFPALRKVLHNETSFFFLRASSFRPCFALLFFHFLMQKKQQKKNRVTKPPSSCVPRQIQTDDKVLGGAGSGRQQGLGDGLHLIVDGISRRHWIGVSTSKN